jgi:hypothetical protein
MKHVRRITLDESLAGERTLPSFVRVKKFLDEKECNRLVASCVGTRRFYRSNGQQLAKRVSISYLLPQADPELTERVEQLFIENNIWNLSLTQVLHPMRVQLYVRGDYNDVHSDYDYETLDYSKLTLVIPLVGRKKWKGGDLRVGNSKLVPKMNLGDAVIFPSFQPHLVSRVHAGSRITLAAWIAGPKLR